jgi:tetratricopeptide (TPR) repeat protein
MEQGFLFEKMGRVKLANEKYKLVLSAYEKRLGDNPMSIKTRADIAFLYLFLEDRNRAIDEIQNLILENPKNEDLKATEELIKNFDRKRFIEEY